MEPDAAFHDIGKLVNWEAVGLRGRNPDGSLEDDPHEFEKCGPGPPWHVDLSAPHWAVIKRLPHPMAHVARHADRMAAGYARTLPEKKLKGTPQYGRYCLWTGTSSPDSRLVSRTELQELIRRLNETITWAEAEAIYGGLLVNRPETARPGLNVTSLLSHCRIVGKLARVMATALPRDSSKALGTAAGGQIPLWCSLVRVRTRHRQWRARDVNILEYHQQVWDDILSRYADHVMTIHGRECFVVFATDRQRLAFLGELGRAGFEIWERPKTGERSRRASEMSRLQGAGLRGDLEPDWRPVAPFVPDDFIEPPLCEACQMAHADRHWPADHVAAFEGLTPDTRRLLRERRWQNIRESDLPERDRGLLSTWLGDNTPEDLCSRCFSVRELSARLPRLGEWTGPAAWLRVSLDSDILERALTLLHREYLRASNPGVDQSLWSDLQVSLPLMEDFLTDYSHCLDDLDQAIRGHRSPADVGHPERSLWAIHLERAEEALDILRAAVEAIRKRFPKLLAHECLVPSPIHVGLSIGQPKHPFYRHWRFLEAVPAEIAVQTAGSGMARIRLVHAPFVLDALSNARRERRQLHRLREIQRYSPLLADVALQDKARGGLDRVSPSATSSLVPGYIDASSLLTLVELAGG